MPLSFVFLAYRICPLVLKLQNASDTHCNRVNNKTTTSAGLSIEIIGGLLFLPGHENIIEVMMLIRITGESVKFSFINMSLHTLNRFTLHNSDDISLRLFRSVNT